MEPKRARNRMEPHPGACRPGPQKPFLLARAWNKMPGVRNPPRGIGRTRNPTSINAGSISRVPRTAARISQIFAGGLETHIEGGGFWHCAHGKGKPFQWNEPHYPRWGASGECGEWRGKRLTLECALCQNHHLLCVSFECEDILCVLNQSVSISMTVPIFHVAMLPPRLFQLRARRIWADLTSQPDPVIMRAALFCSFSSFWLRPLPIQPHTALQ